MNDLERFMQNMAWVHQKISATDPAGYELKETRTMAHGSKTKLIGIDRTKEEIDAH
tara:strand:- start:759 stop:926 length:168 start_codon:yes stop_codon:yes gene_type:complete